MSRQILTTKENQWTGKANNDQVKFLTIIFKVVQVFCFSWQNDNGEFHNNI